MISVRSTAVRVAILCVFLSWPVHGQRDDPSTQPTDSGVVERTERRMLQLEISISVSNRDFQDRAAALGKEDFILRIAREVVPAEHFEVDNLCQASDLGRAPSSAPPNEPSGKRATGAFEGNLVLYLDYLHLRTLPGQANAADMIRHMIPELIQAGNRLKIVAGWSPVHTLVDWSSDEQHLLKRFNESQDRPFPFSSEGRLTEEKIAAHLRANHVEEAIELARAANLSEQTPFQRASDPLAEFVGKMIDVPRPKALFYFADSAYFSRAGVVERAVASGVRIYVIKADGLGQSAPRGVPLAYDPVAIVRSSFSSLASRTGGRVSLGHYRKSAIAQPLRYLREDFECVYLISLDVSRMERDRDLVVDVGLADDLRKHMRADTIPRIRVSSEAALREQAAASAFASAGSRNIRAATLAVIPFEITASGVKALLQFAVDTDSALPSALAAWDVGIVSTGKSRRVNQSNRRIESNASRIVFETAVELPLGEYRVIAAAQEVDREGLARNDLAGHFAKPKRTSFAFLRPVVALQWEPAAFVFEEDDPRFEGWAALPYKMARADAALSFRSILCPGKGFGDTLRVERSLRLPEREAAFEPVMWKAGSGSRCLPLDDVVSAGELPWNGKPYEVTYSIRASESTAPDHVAEDAVSFWVIGPAAPEGTTGAQVGRQPGAATVSAYPATIRRR